MDETKVILNNEDFKRLTKRIAEPAKPSQALVDLMKKKPLWKCKGE